VEECEHRHDIEIKAFVYYKPKYPFLAQDIPRIFPLVIQLGRPRRSKRIC
jgi:hypothetical protein